MLYHTATCHALTIALLVLTYVGVCVTPTYASALRRAKTVTIQRWG